ncbi:iron-sulfur cluster co-chaperone protein HscB-like [Branchiostoma floridae]|uniref:Iron-sulfur cluster co-chaperone protein HscB-like n=1 Tax=Branchiostoma floridae TaxID=7739 RepID=A0A9J7LWI6_BRAFL|nr:iron-sulfur cluster co-chaperone protein HscB-like [Branchiostoma floridae]
MAAKLTLSRVRRCFFDKNAAFILQQKRTISLLSKTTTRHLTPIQATSFLSKQASRTPFFPPEVGASLLPRMRSYCSVSRACWSCSRQTTGWFFCEFCQMVQPPAPQATLFDVMDCAKKFDVDNTKLSVKYKDLQRLLHPDRFSQHGEVEQDYASAQSAWVNKAYWTLQKPLSRGLYMLQLEGESIEEGEKLSDPELLMEVMEANERLGEAETEEEVRSVAEENREKLDRLCKELSDAFDKGDVSRAKEILTRMQYYSNIEDKVKERLPPS